MSMLITNDVSLITFVPFTVLILTITGQEKLMVFVIVLQTIAANLGSMLTPIGNPQNLYLYSLSGMSFSGFLGIMLPYTLLSALLLLLFLFLKPGEKVYVQEIFAETRADAAAAPDHIYAAVLPVPWLRASFNMLAGGSCHRYRCAAFY